MVKCFLPRSSDRTSWCIISESISIRIISPGCYFVSDLLVLFKLAYILLIGISALNIKLTESDEILDLIASTSWSNIDLDYVSGD